MATFSYQHIQHNDEIRVIVLRCAELESPLTCKLMHIRLTESPRYEALSYTWGSSEKEYTISIDSKLVGITKSLYIALKNLRRHGPSLRSLRRDRIIWADALCINQDDDEEKSVQVGMMGKIYSMASSVIIWIGEDPYTQAASAFAAIRKADNFLAKHAANYRAKLTKNQVGYRDSHVDDVEMSTDLIIKLVALGLEPIEPLLDHTWYGRMWIVQEAVLGQRPTIQYGKESMDWMTVGAVAEAFLSLDVTSYLDFVWNRQTLERIATIYSIQQNIKSYYDECSELTILDLVDNTGDFSCSDSRDEIFALLSLASTEGYKPQYSRSAPEVFIEFSKWVLQRQQNLDILSYAGLSLRHESSLQIPSWSLSPSSKREGCSFLCAGHFHASAVQPIESVGIDSLATFNTNSMMLQGMLLDNIIRLGDPLCLDSRRPAGSTDLRDTMPHAEEWNQWLHSTLSVGNRNWSSLSGHDKDDLYKAMFCNLGINGEPADRDAALWFQWMFSDLQNPSRTKQKAVEHNDEIDLIDVSIGRWAARRRFCVTKEGHYGWVPEISELGDVIFVIRGARVPFVLRRQGGSQHLLIGEAWVQGFMEGEALEKGNGIWGEIEIL